MKENNSLSKTEIVSKILKEVHQPSYPIPNEADQSYVMLILSIAAAKRQLPNLNTLANFEEKDEQDMIDYGMKTIEGKVSGEQYAEKFLKIVKKYNGEKIIDSDYESMKNQIAARVNRNKNSVMNPNLKAADKTPKVKFENIDKVKIRNRIKELEDDLQKVPKNQSETKKKIEEEITELRAKLYSKVKFESIDKNFKVDEEVYKGNEKVKITRIDGDKIFIKSIKNSGRPEEWVKQQDLSRSIWSEGNGFGGSIGFDGKNAFKGKNGFGDTVSGSSMMESEENNIGLDKEKIFKLLTTEGQFWTPETPEDMELLNKIKNSNVSLEKDFDMSKNKACYYIFNPNHKEELGKVIFDGINDGINEGVSDGVNEGVNDEEFWPDETVPMFNFGDYVSLYNYLKQVEKDNEGVKSFIASGGEDIDDWYESVLDNGYVPKDEIDEPSPIEIEFNNGFKLLLEGIFKKFNEGEVKKNLKKYKVIKGIKQGHNFKGYPITIDGETRIWDAETVGNAYPVENCEVLEENRVIKEAVSNYNGLYKEEEWKEIKKKLESEGFKIKMIDSNTWRGIGTFTYTAIYEAINSNTNEKYKITERSKDGYPSKYNVEKIDLGTSVGNIPKKKNANISGKANIRVYTRN